MKILVADDSPLDRSVLAISLQKWGYDVIECGDGREAVDIMTGKDPPPQFDDCPVARNRANAVQ